MNQIIIESGSRIDKMIYAKEGRIQRFEFCDREASVREGQIYKGIVKKVLQGMNAAMIDLGDERTGYLQEENLSRYLKASDEILVQVKREQIQEKYPKLSRDIRLIGKNLILLPRSKGVKISRKRSGPIDRTALENLLRKDTGIILRSGCEADLHGIQSEYQELLICWDQIKAAYDRKYRSGLLFEQDFFGKFILDTGLAHIDQMVSNDAERLKKLKAALKDRVSIGSVKAVDTEYVIDYCLLFDEFKRLFDRRVPVDEAISIVIEHTEAFVVIDVNSGSNWTYGDFEQNVLQANQKAAKEIARQIILRDLAGVILIDFIDMKQQRHRQELIDTFRWELSADKRPCSVLSMTELGILQVVRKKEKDSLMSRMTQECTHCAGSGRVFSSTFALDEQDRAHKMRKKHESL